MNIKAIYIKVVLLLALCFTVGCSEDTVENEEGGIVTGQVVLAVENTPLKNVKIETTPLTTTVFTDEEGKFTLEDVTMGDYSVKASLEGYQVVFKPLKVYPGKSSNVVIEMSKETGNNTAPSTPLLLSPKQGEELEDNQVKLVWSARDKEKDVLTYTLEIHNDSDGVVEVIKEIKDTVYEPKNLQYGRKYFWQVTVSDGMAEAVKSNLGTFVIKQGPESNRVLFVRQVKSNFIIYSRNEAGKEYPLTEANTNSFRPKLNQAANKIAYFQSNGAAIDLYVMDRDGANKLKITHMVRPAGFNANEISFAWPENSEYLYFSNFNKLYRIKSNGQGLEKVYETTDNTFISEVDVNEAQQLIVLKTNDNNGYNVSIKGIDFSGALKFTVLDKVKGAVSGVHLSWDAKQIVYAHDVSGYESFDYKRRDSRIFLYDIAGNQSQNISTSLITPGTNDLEPSFSPNNAYIIFTNTSNDGISPKNVYQQEISLNVKENQRVLLISNAMMPEWR